MYLAPSPLQHPGILHCLLHILKHSDLTGDRHRQAGVEEVDCDRGGRVETEEAG